MLGKNVSTVEVHNTKYIYCTYSVILKRFIYSDFEILLLAQWLYFEMKKDNLHVCLIDVTYFTILQVITNQMSVDKRYSSVTTNSAKGAA